MLKSSGIPHNAKKKQFGITNKEIDAIRAHKSPQSKEKAKEIVEGSPKPLTREQAIEAYNKLKSQSGG